MNPLLTITLILAPIAGAATFAPPARAADPLACTDERVMQRIGAQYAAAEEMSAALKARPALRLAAIVEPREVGSADRPAALNQYATATTYIAASRYCRGRAEPEAGDSETIYWRVDLMKDGEDESIRIDFCSVRHDPFEDGCKAYRLED